MSHFKTMTLATEWREQFLSNKQGQTSASQSRKTKGLSVSPTLESSIQISHPQSSSAKESVGVVSEEVMCEQGHHFLRDNTHQLWNPQGWFYLELLCNLFYARRLYRMTIRSPCIFPSVMPSFSVLVSPSLFLLPTTLFSSMHCSHSCSSPKKEPGLGKIENQLCFNL